MYLMPASPPQGLIGYLIKRYNWDELESIVDNEECNSKLLKCILLNSNTPLHEICNIGSAPLNLVEKIMHSWADATVTRNRFGETPLHIKCKNSQYSSTPVSKLISCNDTAARMMNNTGHSPLAIACMSGACFAVIRELVVAYPDALLLKDVNGHTPIDLLWFNFSKTIPGTLAINAYLKRKKKNRCDDTDGRDVEMGGLLSRFYEKISFCFIQTSLIAPSIASTEIAASLMDENNQHAYGSSLLRNAIILQKPKHCTHPLLEIMLSYDPTLGMNVDVCGNSPLHLQISRDLLNRKNILVLLDKAPGSAKIKNEMGMLPLHLALKGMKTSKEALAHKRSRPSKENDPADDSTNLIAPINMSGIAADAATVALTRKSTGPPMAIGGIAAEAAAVALKRKSSESPMVTGGIAAAAAAVAFEQKSTEPFEETDHALPMAFCSIAKNFKVAASKNDENDIIGDIIRVIANAHVEALDEMDAETMMHPFILAAIAGSLELSFDFLLKSPNVVQYYSDV